MVTAVGGRLLAVWSVLVAATFLSWWLGSTHPGPAPGFASEVIILAAVVKVRFIGLYFMELRHAPTTARLLFEGYCVVLAASMTAMFWFA